jgi:hypothetical protein
MDSVPLKEIKQKADEYDATLLATDPRFRRSATLIHEDGSYLHFDSAFLMRIDSVWIACFTEHHGVHVYHHEDLSSFWESEQRRTAIEELP